MITEHITVKGSKIVIDERGVAEVKHPKITERILLGDGSIGGEITGLRDKYTLQEINVKTPKAMLKAVGTPFRVTAYGLTSRKGYTLALSSDDLDWLRANWPIDTTPTREDKWDALMPTDARLLRDWNGKMDDWQREFDRCMNDEMRSSFAPKMPTDPKPELTPEGKAWLELDNAQSASLYYKAGFARDAIDKAIDGTPLVDAYNEYKKRLDEETDKHIWD